MNRALKAFLSAALIGLLPWAAIAAEKQPTVVELYTSQGCSSCPPADAYLGELVKRPDVLGLTFHVDYWDYLGWKDPFAKPEHTQRQRSYTGKLRMRYVYTPQMIIQGITHAVGSNEGEVTAGIAAALKKPRLSVSLTVSKKIVTVSVPAARAAERAEILLVAYDDKHSTAVRRGENSGRKLSYYNVVRDIRRLGTWTGEALTLTADVTGMSPDGADGCAVLLQVPGGRILGAAAVDLNAATN